MAVATEFVNALARLEYQPLADGRHPVVVLLEEVRVHPDHADPKVGECAGCLERALHTAVSGRGGDSAATGPGRRDAAPCPWPGLLAYDWGRDPRLARLFFGREDETAALLDDLCRLRPGDLLIVSGASGSGKSSLVKAGLWRALHDPTPEQARLVPRGRDWAVSTMTPGLFDDPFEGLADSARAASAAGTEIRPAATARRLREDPDHVTALLTRVLAGRPAWLLILDQFEEVFAPQAAAHRDAFLAFLLRAVADPRLRLVATIRSDYLHRLNDRPDTCPLLNRQKPRFVAPPGPGDLARIIAEPAVAAGLRVEPPLVEHLVDEAYGRGGGLALLAAALEELHRTAPASGVLTLAHYREVVGGLPRILERRAARGFELLAGRLGTSTPADLLPRVFVHLVNVDERTGEPTRQRAPQDLGEWLGGAEDGPALRLWLARDGGAACTRWYPRRPGIGDLLAVLGERRRGLGRRRDGLPDLAWVTIPPGPSAGRRRASTGPSSAPTASPAIR